MNVVVVIVVVVVAAADDVQTKLRFEDRLRRQLKRRYDA